jgi:polyisoprenyl-teichoic acid--peptidoglycan teichoic acid transferase
MVVLPQTPDSTIVSVPDYDPGSPSGMTILVLGSDHRSYEEEEEYGRSDTIILVRVDPDHDYLSVLSLPRDLRVKVPGYGMDKINAAYAYGGPALAIETVEEATGIDINHYVEVDFEAFKDITDALGGVYAEVDQRYFNDDWDWEPLDLQPGYQLLNGEDALDFCRFRHDDNMDFGRMERQQRFLSALRQQAMGWNLATELPGLIDALFSNVATDLGANDILRLAWWGIRLDGERIRQVTVVGDTKTIGGISYVLFDEEVMAEAVTDFLTIPSSGAAITTTTTESDDSAATTDGSGDSTTTTLDEGELSGLEIDVLNGNGRAGEAAAVQDWLTDLGATVSSVGKAEEPAALTTVEYPSSLATAAKEVGWVVDAASVSRNRSRDRITVVLGDDFTLPPEYALPPDPENIPNSDWWKGVAELVPFAVRAPAYLPRGYLFEQRFPQWNPTYDIDGENPGSKPAFTILYRYYEDGDETDQYLDIMETTWLDAPAACDGKELIYGGTVFTVVGSRDKVERIWWKADDVLYWVSNTLSHLLSEEELIAVARSMVHIPPE